MRLQIRFLHPLLVDVYMPGFNVLHLAIQQFSTAVAESNHESHDRVAMTELDFKTLTGTISAWKDALVKTAKPSAEDQHAEGDPA